MIDEKELEEQLNKHGYKLHKITKFKTHDRVIVGNDKIKISMNLRGKLSEIALETLIEVCVGSSFLWHYYKTQEG